MGGVLERSPAALGRNEGDLAGLIGAFGKKAVEAGDRVRDVGEP